MARNAAHRGWRRAAGQPRWRACHRPHRCPVEGIKAERLLSNAIPTIGGHDVTVLMHNDAVVQGLSEVPFMRDVEHWGVMTIGTGLGREYSLQSLIHDSKIPRFRAKFLCYYK
jgi:hypothetical protein